MRVLRIYELGKRVKSGYMLPIATKRSWGMCLSHVCCLCVFVCMCMCSGVLSVMKTWILNCFLQNSGLLDELENMDEITIFAPSNDAMETLNYTGAVVSRTQEDI